jgi:3-methyladenine DNA glycosylase AlkD
MWLRRAAAVALTRPARHGLLLDEAYEVARSLLGDEEDLIHKATGWLLRDAGVTDKKRLRAFLLECGPAVPRTALRYAIEHFPKAERKRLLAATRAT